MFTKNKKATSRSIAISLLFLVGCSELSNNKSDSNSPSSFETSAPIDQPTHDRNLTNQDTSKKMAPIPEMVQNVVNAIHQKIQNGEIDLAKENNLDIREINISTTGGGYPYPNGFNPFGDMIYVKNVQTGDLITIKWIQSDNGYELVGYSFPSHDTEFNCPGPCTMYYPQ